MEESKTYEEFKSKVTEQPFYGSDAEAYTDSDNDADGQYGAEDDLRDDFSLSDTGAQGGEEEEYCEDIEDEMIDEEDGDDDERRERQFFGDEEYTILSKVPEEEGVEALSMTM